MSRHASCVSFNSEEMKDEAAMRAEETETIARREQDIREILALESAWEKIDCKISSTPGGVQRQLVVKFTLFELKMLRQFRRKFA